MELSSPIYRELVYKGELPPMFVPRATPEHLLPPQGPRKPVTVKSTVIPRDLVRVGQAQPKPPGTARRVGTAISTHPVRTGVLLGLPAAGAGGAAVYHHEKVNKSMSVSAWGVDHGYDEISKDAPTYKPNKESRTKDYAFGHAALSALPGGWGLGATIGHGAVNARPGRRAAVVGRSVGRQAVEGLAGAGAGGAAGALAANALTGGRLRAMRTGGQIGGLIGGVGGTVHGAYSSAMASGRRGDLRQNRR